MPRGRFLSRDLSVNNKFWHLPDSEHRCFWQLLILWLDAEGRIEGDAAVIKGRVCPLADWTVEDVEGMLKKFETIKRSDGLGWIERYHSHGKYCLWAAGFDEHQVNLRKDHEAKGKYGYSEIPPPPKRLLDTLGKLTKDEKPPSHKASSKQPIDESLIADERLAGMVNYYRETLGRDVMPTDFENMKSILDEFGDDAFKRAVDAAKSHDARSPMRYIDTCLAEWASKGEVGKPKTIPEAEDAFRG